MKEEREQPVESCKTILAVLGRIAGEISDAKTRDGALIFAMHDMATKSQGLSDEIRNQYLDEALQALSQITLIGPVDNIIRKIKPNGGPQQKVAEGGPAPQITKPKADIVLLTIITIEFEAALRVFGIDPATARREFEIHGIKFYAATIPKSDRPDGCGGLKILIAMSGRPRNVHCVNICRDILQHIDTEAVVLAGIAGGNRKKNIELGDVVAAEAIVDIEGGRSEIVPKIGIPFRNRSSRYDHFMSTWAVKLFGGQKENMPRIEMHDLDTPMDEYVRQFKPDENLLREKVRSVLEQYSANELPDKNLHSLSYRRGHIMCGEKVLADGSVPEMAARHHGNILAVDMESSGFSAACHHCKKEWAIFRGISDFADPKKGDRWHVPAAVAASAGARAFLSRGYSTPSERDEIW